MNKKQEIQESVPGVPQRWSWKRWQQAVSSRIAESHAVASSLASAWPLQVKGTPYRSFWAHEITYRDAPLARWSMSRVMAAATELVAVELAYPVPGTPMYIPTMPGCMRCSAEVAPDAAERFCVTCQAHLQGEGKSA